MTTTITAAQALLILGGIIGPAVASAALGGALALGLASVLANRRQKSSGQSSTGHSSHSGHHGEGYGHKKRRRRGAVGTGQERGERLMQLARQQDGSHCGMKMVCHLANQGEDQLSGEEKAILDLVRWVPPGENHKPGSGPWDYTEALNMGLGGANCSHVYTNCPFEGSSIMDTVMAFLP